MEGESATLCVQKSQILWSLKIDSMYIDEHCSIIRINYLNLKDHDFSNPLEFAAFSTDKYIRVVRLIILHLPSTFLTYFWRNSDIRIGPLVWSNIITNSHVAGGASSICRHSWGFLWLHSSKNEIKNFCKELLLNAAFNFLNCHLCAKT